MAAGLINNSTLSTLENLYLINVEDFVIYLNQSNYFWSYFYGENTTKNNQFLKWKTWITLLILDNFL